MYLCRIKNAEQLKRINPGDFGKLLGLDRIPEAKCYRSKIKQISEQGKAPEWNMELAKSWSKAEETGFYYIDGHVQTYHGYQAHLGKKFVSRQKLCLPGMQEFWVNNSEGMPYFYVTGQVNEKLQEMIKDHLLPMLLENMGSPVIPQDNTPRFTIVFDREAYSPTFFDQIWEEHQVAVLTYRKNVTDSWQEEDFQPYTLAVEGAEVVMQLAEKVTVLDGVSLREIRKLNNNGHQTSVITTHPSLKILTVALYMFARWSQENFFRYMRQDYAFDKISQYTVDQIDEYLEVVNPDHRKLTQQLKKVREKISRRKAKLYMLKQESADSSLDQTPTQSIQQQNVLAELDELLEKEKDLVKQRKEIKYKIMIKDMDEDRYNKLNTESKHFLNVIKMICYRSETSLALHLTNDYAKLVNEKRMWVKSLINTPCDLKVDQQNQKLHVHMHTMATPRDNRAMHKICLLINQNPCLFPGTNLKMIFHAATNQSTTSQEF